MEKYPKLARFWHGQNLIIAIKDPEYVHTIVNNPNALGKLNLYNYLGSFTGNGLITAPGIEKVFVQYYFSIQYFFFKWIYGGKIVNCSIHHLVKRFWTDLSRFLLKSQ